MVLSQRGGGSEHRHIDFIGHFLFHSYRCQMVERIPSIRVSYVYVLNDHCSKLECSDYATL